MDDTAARSRTGADVEGDAPATSDQARRDARHGGTPRRPSVGGVLAEILVTAGVITLLYVAWQLWVGDMIYGVERTVQAEEQSRKWQGDFDDHARATPQATDDPAPADAAARPVILPQPADTEVFGVMYIPRFGGDYKVRIAGGVTRSGTLDPIGIGHYPGSQMPGEVGNFALAAHRTTWGKPFNRIAELHVGDAIIIETRDGWYTYRFRTLEYVTPDAVEVLLPVPQMAGAPADDGYMTMTSCSPMHSLAERIVAYSVYDFFTPRSAGPPSTLTEAIA